MSPFLQSIFSRRFRDGGGDGGGGDGGGDGSGGDGSGGDGSGDSGDSGDSSDSGMGVGAVDAGSLGSIGVSASADSGDDGNGGNNGDPSVFGSMDANIDPSNFAAAMASNPSISSPSIIGTVASIIGSILGLLGAPTLGAVVGVMGKGASISSSIGSAVSNAPSGQSSTSVGGAGGLNSAFGNTKYYGVDASSIFGTSKTPSTSQQQISNAGIQDFLTGYFTGANMANNPLGTTGNSDAQDKQNAIPSSPQQAVATATPLSGNISTALANVPGPVWLAGLAALALYVFNKKD